MQKEGFREKNKNHYFLKLKVILKTEKMDVYEVNP